MYFSVIVAIVESSTSILYHRLTDGILPPDPPEVIDYKRYRREQKFQKRVQNQYHVYKTVDELAAQSDKKDINKETFEETDHS